MSKKKFVLSSSAFNTIKLAEEKINGWWRGGDLDLKTKLYKVVDVYDMKVKLVKRK